MKTKVRNKKNVKINICKRIFFKWTLVVLLIVGIIFVLSQLIVPHIKLSGEKNISLNYNNKYEEKGYKASYLGKDITSDVKVSGKVNSKKLGKYKITYTVKHGMFKKKITRVVTIADKEKPKIETTDEDYYVCPGSDAVPEKIKVTDNYDGDISKRLTYDITKTDITYYAVDSSGNEASIKKKIVYKDKEKPNIKLEGADHLYLYVGDAYNDPGHDVDDNCDDKPNVKTDGNVDTTTPGDYTITYKATDKAGNESSIERHVIVSERNKNGTIYLTFDDGPNEGTTNVILDILKEEGVKATFFVTSRGPDYLIKREYDEGHSLALHTSTHDYSIVYASVDSYFNDLYTVQNRVKNITGYESHIIRFPGGSSNTVSRRYSVGIMTTLTSEVLNRGFKYYDWNLSSGDAEAGSHTAEEIKNNVINNLKKNRANVVLMHDIKPYTRDALRDIIKYGKENGYRFEAITMETEMVTQKVNN